MMLSLSVDVINECVLPTAVQLRSTLQCPVIIHVHSQQSTKLNANFKHA